MNISTASQAKLSNRATLSKNVSAFLVYVSRESYWSTLSELAGFFGVSRYMFGKYERRFKFPTATVLLRMARATGFSIEDILTFRDSGLAENINKAVLYWPCCRPGHFGHLYPLADSPAV